MYDILGKLKKRPKFDNIFQRQINNHIAEQFKKIHGDGFDTVSDNNNNNINKNIEQITDDIGIKRAYDDGATYVHGNTLYIAGSHTAKDWYDDVTKIPVSNTKHATRY